MQHYYRVKRMSGLVSTLHTYDNWDQVKAQFGDNLLAEVNGRGKILQLNYPSSIREEINRLLLSMTSDNIIEVNQKIVDLEEQLRLACCDKAKPQQVDSLVREVLHKEHEIYPWEYTMQSNAAFYNWLSSMECSNPRVTLHQNFYNSVIIPNLFPETKESPTMSESPMFQRIFPDLFKDPDTKAVESALSSKLQAAIEDLKGMYPDNPIDLATPVNSVSMDWLLALVKAANPFKHKTIPTTPVDQNPITPPPVSRYFTTASYKKLDEGIKEFICRCSFTWLPKVVSDEKLEQLRRVFQLNSNNFESAISVVLEPLMNPLNTDPVNLFTLDSVQDNHLHISVTNNLGRNPLFSVKYEDCNFVMKLH